ncbi:MAG TPA: acylphosphatase [Sedimenticola sp.]|nr:acylphosphatase [Sedimenticola sp.]
MKTCVRCIVSGRVQGVFFRANTRHQAERLNITGYARNLHDGRVEVVACGEPRDVEQLKDWLRRGPEAAEVTGIATEVITPREFSGFSVG